MAFLVNHARPTEPPHSTTIPCPLLNYSMEMTLTPIEKIALVGILARQQQVLAPLQQELQTLIRAVEDRLGLEPGSVGKTHNIDVDTGRVAPVAPPSAPEDA